MPIAHGLQAISDFSSLRELVEPNRNLLEKLGLFSEEYLDVTMATLERIQDGEDAIKAKARGGERNYAGRENAIRKILEIPFFPLDVAITPLEIQDFRKFLEGDETEDLANRVERAVRRIRRSHDILRRKAMYAALKGTSYTGLAEHQHNVNYYTLWGQTQKTLTNDFTQANVNPSAALEEARQHIVDNAKDDADAYTLIALCGREFFNAYIDHPLVDDDLFGDQPNRERIGGNLIEREFSHKGVTFLLDASGEIDSKEAWVIPLGIADMMKISYAPADTLDAANSTALDMYTFLVETPRKMMIETETSFLCSNTRPELIIKITGTV